MTPRELEEYRALRATIRERGTARVWIFVVGLGIWGGLVIATASPSPRCRRRRCCRCWRWPASSKRVFALHTGVERVGRYIQVFYESDRPGDSLELGTHRDGVRPCLSEAAPAIRCSRRFFWIATVCNFIPAVLAGAVPVEWTVIGVAHVLFIVRVVIAERHARRDSARPISITFQKAEERRQPIAPAQS